MLDSQAPVCVLVESKNLAGKSHSERQQEQQNTDEPGQLSGVFVSSEKEDLHHVDQDDRDHEVRSPAVQGANKPPKRDLVIDHLQGFPRLSRGRNIQKSEEDSVTICSANTVRAALPKT
jgi:hypothetical protein